MTDFLQGLWQQKVRTAASLSGVAWGTLSVILLLAFGYGLQGDLKNRASAMGRSIVVVWPEKTTLPFAGLSEGRRLRLRADDLLKLKAQIPELGAISPEYQNHDTLRSGDRIHHVRLSGVYPSFRDLRTMIPKAGGRFINQHDIDLRRRVVFLGDRIKAQLFGDSLAVGQTLVLRGVSFTVIGILEPKKQDSDYGGLDQDRVYLPATTHARLFDRQAVSNFVYRAKSPALHDRAIARVYATLGRIYRFDPNDRSALRSWDTTENERMQSHLFLGFNTVLAASGILTLLIGGIGVANLMYLLVRQRTHEIGILIAIGARPTRILLQTLGQTQALVFSGGLLGILLAGSVIAFINRSNLTETIGTPTVSPFLAGLTVIFLAATGLIAGYFPARRASRLDPARVLSEE